MRTMQLAALTSAMLLALPSTFAADCHAPEWSAEQQYTGGETVTFDSGHFTARYWVSQTAPDRTQQWGPWQFIEDCNDSSNPTKPVNTVVPLSQTYELGTTAEVIYELQLEDGVSLTNIQGISEADYQISGSNLILHTEFVENLASGLYQFELVFSAGSSVTIDLLIETIAQPLPLPVLTPLQQSVAQTNIADMFFSLDLMGDQLLSIANTSRDLAVDQEYWLQGSQLIFSSDYLSHLAVGSHEHILSFQEAQSLSLTISVTPGGNSVYSLAAIDAQLTAGAELVADKAELNHGLVEWQYPVAAAGTYNIDIDVMSPYGNKTNSFFVGQQRKQASHSGDAVQRVSFTNVELTTGAVNIGVDGQPNSNWGYIDVLGANVTLVALDVPTPTLSPASREFNLVDVRPVSFTLDLDGAELTTINFAGNELQLGSDYQLTGSNLTLNEGLFLGLAQDSSHPLIIEFSQSDALSAVVNIISQEIVLPENGQLVTPNATLETVALFNNLLAIPDDKFLFGQQDTTAYGRDGNGEKWSAWQHEDPTVAHRPIASDIYDVTGAFPAVYGFDMEGIGTEKNIDGVPWDTYKRTMIEAYQRGGIVTASYHAPNFANEHLQSEGSVVGKSWDTSANLLFEVQPGGAYHDELKQRLTLIAEFFKSLKTDDGTLVPVIFRPWHEGSGDFFWWGIGAYGAGNGTPGNADQATLDAFKNLFRFTVEFMRDELGVTNVIYSFCSDWLWNWDEQALENHYKAMYPGSAYVDMIAQDNYWQLETPYSPNSEGERFAKTLRDIVAFAKQEGKPAALSETGRLKGQPEWFSKHLMPMFEAYPETLGISYVLVWRNPINRNDQYIIPFENNGSVEAEDFLLFYNDPMSLFLDTAPNMYQSQ